MVWYKKSRDRLKEVSRAIRLSPISFQYSKSTALIGMVPRLLRKDQYLLFKGMRGNFLLGNA